MGRSSQVFVIVGALALVANSAGAAGKARRLPAPADDAPLNHFGSDITPALRAQLTSDMQFLTSITGSGGSSLDEQVFGSSGSISGAAYSSYFDQRVTGFSMNDCGGGTAVLACVIPSTGHTMWITQNFLTYDMPQVERLSTLLHEARHTEDQNDNWPHVNCPTPFLDADGNTVRGYFSGTILAGLPACDTTAVGAYAAGLIFLKNVSRFCSNCTDKVKMDGSLFADDTFKRIVDPEASRQLRSDLY
jgi:hypothetical protein